MTAKSMAKDPRQERLARALRENLKRRKAQIRGRAEKGAGNDEQALGEQALGQALGNEASGKLSGQKG